MNISSSALGPVAKGGGGLDGGSGTGDKPGQGGSGTGFGGRGAGKRAAISGGGTKDTERAVGAALNWIARHQNRDGSWGIDHDANCKGIKCTGNGKYETATTAGTAAWTASVFRCRSNASLKRSLSKEYPKRNSIPDQKSERKMEL